MVSFFGCTGAKNINATIYVATDTHYLSSTINDGGTAFQNMMKNTDGKVVEYCDEIFEAFSSEVVEAKPDVLILSGDLTFNGEKASHEDFVKKLKHINESGVQVLAIAGNHDIDNKNATQFKGDKTASTQSVTADEFRELYFEFGMKQAVSVDKYSLSYLYKINDKLYALMLDTNAYGQNFVQDLTYQWIESQLKEISSKNAQVITVSHQNLFAHNDQLSFGYQLYDGNELLELYNKYKVALNLSGHIHLQHIMENGVTEIVTSSLLVSPIQYGIINYNGKISYNTKSVDVAAWANKTGSQNSDLVDFANYAKKVFLDSGIQKGSELAQKMNLSSNDAKAVALAFAELNTAYFAGTKCNKASIDKGIQILEGQDGFMSKYMITMLDEADKDYTSCTIKKR